MTNIEFTPLFDTVFDCRGVYTVASGTSPHNPDEARVVLRNAEPDKITVAASSEVAAAAELGQSELKQTIKKLFAPRRGDRAAGDNFWASQNPDNDEWF